jgi:hypothetical protein
VAAEEEFHKGLSVSQGVVEHAAMVPPHP